MTQPSEDAKRWALISSA